MQSAIKITKAQLWLILIIENLSQLLEDFCKMQAKPTCHFTFGYRQVKRRKKRADNCGAYAAAPNVWMKLD